MLDQLPQELLDAVLHTYSPRVRFLKTLPHNSRVLDLGAGDGSLSVFKSWLEPMRPDLRLCGVSLDPGRHQRHYEIWRACDFEKGDPLAGEMFDAVFTAHFAEHIDGGASRVLGYCVSKLRPMGRVYIEMPSPMSKRGPTRECLRKAGYPVMTTNFFDDATHVETVDIDQLRQAMAANGLFVEESGYWRNPFIEPELLRRSVSKGDEFMATAAVWMATRFAQYAIGVRDDVENPSWGTSELREFAG